MIAIVGNLGSGKTLYSRSFSENGYTVFDEYPVSNIDDPNLYRFDVIVSQLGPEVVSKFDPEEIHHVKSLPPMKAFFGLFSFTPVRVKILKKDPEIGAYIHVDTKTISLERLKERYQHLCSRPTA